MLGRELNTCKVAELSVLQFPNFFQKNSRLSQWIRSKFQKLWIIKVWRHKNYLKLFFWGSPLKSYCHFPSFLRHSYNSTVKHKWLSMATGSVNDFHSGKLIRIFLLEILIIETNSNRKSESVLLFNPWILSISFQDICKTFNMNAIDRNWWRWQQRLNSSKVC